MAVSIPNTAFLLQDFTCSHNPRTSAWVSLPDLKIGGSWAKSAWDDYKGLTNFHTHHVLSIAALCNTGAASHESATGQLKYGYCD